MTDIEKAKHILKTGSCIGLSCGNVEGEVCPLREKHEDGISGTPIHLTHSEIEYVRKWLEGRMPEKEIIGWPGNAEEMKQYIGRTVMFSDVYDKGWEGPGELIGVDSGGNDIDLPFLVGGRGRWWRYIKVLPAPVVKEYTIQEIADRLGVPVETIRIKDK